MAKRIADKELTDRNWDQEEEGEEAGTFLLASEDVLKGRAIKKAKRRNVPEGEGSATFKGFKGFSLTTTTAAASGGGSAPTAFSGFGNGGGFKGLSGLTNGSAPMFGGFSTHAAKPAAAPGLTFNGPAPSDITAKQSNGSSSSSSSSPCVSTSVSTSVSASGKEYSRQLTALNVSVRDWITKHVNDNPLCDLNPIFRDYERHLASIERQYGAAAAAANDSEEKKKKPAEATPPPAAPPVSSSSSSASLFSFNKSTADDSAKSAAVSSSAAVTFNFGQKVDSAVLGSLGAAKMSPSFSFCTSSSSSSSSSSGGQTSSLFGAAPAPPPAPAAPSFTKTEENRPAGTDENGDEESDEPPKPEVKEVKEDDAFYSKKCKLFYKKDSEFKEKGVGTLHLKNTEDSKVQMIIRADTNLGNILLNILLQASLPCSRVGQKHVMVVCVPNPPLDDKNPRDPVPLLIRVRTPQDADELLRTLEERKG